jgi:endonuclease-3
MSTSTAINWPIAIKPLLKKYKDAPSVLHYHNLYQAVVMVVLSAQTTDAMINQLAPALFKAYPHMEDLAKAKDTDLFPYIKSVRSFGQKAKYLTEIATTIKKDKDIPHTLEALTALPGIGRKSANVIIESAGLKPEGVIVDLHVLRVAPRLGIAQGTDPKKIEKQLMEELPQSQWSVGRAMSMLGREICRPKPECDICLMNKVCHYFQELKAAQKTKEK